MLDHTNTHTVPKMLTLDKELCPPTKAFELKLADFLYLVFVHVLNNSQIHVLTGVAIATVQRNLLQKQIVHYDFKNEVIKH